MKHIIKVASLQNLPNTRPLIAMDNNGNLGWEPKKNEPEPTLLTLTVSGESMGCDDVIVQYVEGWTWQDYLESKYNTELYYSYNRIYGPDWWIYSSDSTYGWSDTQPSEIIHSDWFYEFTD